MKDQNNQNEHHWKVLVLLLKKIAASKGIAHSLIAERTGLQKSNVTRMFALKYNVTLPVFLKVANAIGVNFFFEDKDGDTDLSIAFEEAMEELGRRKIEGREN